MRFKHFVLGFVIALLSDFLLYAQINPYLDFQYDVQKFSVDDGLPGNSVNALAKDDLGFIWIATAGGLSRYDGHSFVTIPIPGDSLNGSSDVYVTNVRNVPKVGIAVTTKTRHYLYHTQSQQWTILSDASYLVYSGFPSSYMQSFGDSILSINSTTPNSKGIYFISPKGNSTLFMRDIVYDFDLHNNTLWTASFSDLIQIDSNFNYTRYPHHLTFSPITSNIAVRKGKFGSYFYAFTRATSTTDKRISFIYKLNLHQGNVSYTLIDSLQDSNGLIETDPNRIWVTTEYNGLYIIDTQTKRKIRVTDIPAFKPYFDQFLPRQIYLFDDIIWVAGNGTGLIKIDLTSRKFSKLSDGTEVGDLKITNLTKTIRTQGDNIWLVNHNEPFGVQRLNLKNNTGTQFTLGKSFQKFAPIDLEIAPNNWVYVGFLSGPILGITPDGKNRTEIFNKYLMPFNDDVSFNRLSFFSGIIDKDQTGLWVAGRYLVYHINANHIVDRSITLDINSNGNFMWQMGGFVDTVRNGLWLTVAHKIQFIHFDTEEKIEHTFPEFLLNDTKHISRIQRDDALNNNLWITSENGLMYYEPETQRRRYFSTKDGLPNNFIYGLLTDSQGNLWLSSNKGLSKATISLDQENLPLLTFKNYTVKDGLQSNEFNSFGYHKDEKGVFWFSGVGGINWFHPDSIKTDEKTPSPVIQGVRVFNELLQTDTSFHYKKNYTLRYKESDFSIEFSGITYRRSDEVNYAYKLVGQDSDWILSGRETRARYTNLSPGVYPFLVKAANYDGVWSEPLTIWITILAPFWLQSWFLVCCGFLFIGFIYANVRYLSTRKYKKLLVELEKREMINHERARIAQDLHDELGANLTQISLLSELVQREIQSSGKTSTPLKKVAEAAKTGVTNLSEIVWSLNPKNDSLENVVAYIQEYADGYFNGTSIRVLFDIDEQFPALAVSSDVRHALLMTIKECLNNALKYSQAHTIWIHIHAENQKLIIVIQDNGIGFSVHEMMGKGNGLFHQLNRLKTYKGEVHIDSEPGKGCETRIVLRLGD